MAEVHGHTGLLIGLLRSGVTGDDQVLLFLDLLCGREVGNRPSGLVERHALCVSRCIAVEVQLEGGPVVGSFSRPLGSAFRAVDGDFVHIDFSVAHGSHLELVQVGYGHRGTAGHAFHERTEGDGAPVRVECFVV